MIGTTSRQSWLFYLPLARQAVLLQDDLLDPVDDLLDDPHLVELVRQCLAVRSPSSIRTGRPSIAPDRLLRCCVAKHLKGWSFRELERQVRSNLVYRRFTRFDGDPTPNFSTFCRTFALLSPVTEQIQQRVVGLTSERGVAAGRKMRSDTTVVESNVHPPSDSTLLGDGIRVLTRHLERIASQCDSRAVVVVDHARAVKRRLLEISRAAKSLTEAGQRRLEEGYRKLLAVTGGVGRQAGEVLEGLQSGGLKVVGDLLWVETQAAPLRRFLPLVGKVVAQTRERIWEGNRHVVGKVLSLFEPHTQAIRKGKAHQPTEFGRLLRIDQVENGIVSHYQVLEGNPADPNAWVPALEQHQAQFGRPSSGRCRKATAPAVTRAAIATGRGPSTGRTCISVTGASRARPPATTSRKPPSGPRETGWRPGNDCSSV